MSWCNPHSNFDSQLGSLENGLLANNHAKPPGQRIQTAKAVMSYPPGVPDWQQLHIHGTVAATDGRELERRLGRPKEPGQLCK